jgi:hypothetical protein
MAAGSHIQLRGMSRRAFTIEGADGRLNEIRLCRMVSAETGVPSRFRRGAEVTAQRLEELSDLAAAADTVISPILLCRWADDRGCWMFVELVAGDLAVQVPFEPGVRSSTGKSFGDAGQGA